MIYCLINKKCWLIFLVSFTIGIGIQQTGNSQNNIEKHRTYINLDFLQSPDKRILTANVTARIKGERGRQKVANVEIEFFNVLDTTEVLLAKSVTNEDGIASFQLTGNLGTLRNEEGEYTYKGVFYGNNEYTDISKSITVRLVDMEVSFVEVDSVRNIVVTGFEVNSKGDKIVVEEDVYFYVPRQFSELKIGECTLEEGSCMIEFPVSLPGDSLGNLTIIARIEESRDFGNVETMSIKDWGAPRTPVTIEKRRGLGDTDAPLWMVYTLIILLSTVWFHYIYILYVVFLVKKEGKKSKSLLNL